MAALLIGIAFFGRVYITGAYAFITYCVAIVYLKNLLLYTQPCDSYLQELEIAVEKEYVLPTRENDEFKPFERKKPEMEVWKSLVKTTLIATLCTFIPFFDLDFSPVVLVTYFLFVVIVMYRAKVKHMQRLNYNPFDLGKKI